MFRYLFSLVILFALASCSTTSSNMSHGNIIPEQKITSQSVEPTIIDDGKFNIAVLVPISKKKDQTGSFLLKSAQLALADSKNSNINLVILDSSMIENDPSMLVTKLTENRVKVILGPVYSNETDKLVSLLSDKDITILSLSNDSSISSPYLLTLGVSPDSQANALMNYAISQGINNFYLMLPATKYGKMIENAVSNIVPTKHDTHFSVNWYSGENIDQVMDEFLDSIKDKNNENSIIYMPQGGSNLSRINDKIQARDLKIRLMGSQAWDHPSIIKFLSFDRAIFLRNHLLDNDFYHNFSRFYGVKPTNIDLIAYNAVSIIANMEEKNLPINRDSIISYNTEFGKNSIKFAQNGSAIYKMSIIEIIDWKFKTVENLQ